VTWRTMSLMAQTLFYTAGVVAMIMLVLLGYQSNERMQREHERIMLITERTLREVLK
jgi:hypothetical protein